MDRQNIRNMWKKIKKILKIVWPLICVFPAYIAGFMTKEEVIENFLEARWARPDIVYSIKDDGEYFTPDIELKDGILSVYPQLVVQKDQTIIRMVALKDVYLESMKLNYEADIKGFRIGNGQWDLAGDLASAIQSELTEHGIDVKTHFVIVMELNYRNKKSHNYKKTYYLMQDMLVNNISRSEADRRLYDYPINLQDWESELDTIVDDCVKAVRE